MGQVILRAPPGRAAPAILPDQRAGPYNLRATPGALSRSPDHRGSLPAGASCSSSHSAQSSPVSMGSPRSPKQRRVRPHVRRPGAETLLRLSGTDARPLRHSAAHSPLLWIALRYLSSRVTICMLFPPRPPGCPLPVFLISCLPSNVHGMDLSAHQAPRPFTPPAPPRLLLPAEQVAPRFMKSLLKSAG